MTGDEIVFSPTIMRQHATNVENVAAQARSAADSVGLTSFDPGAFGVACAFAVPFTAILAAGAGLFMEATANLVDSTVEGVNATADMYEAIETEAKDISQLLEQEIISGEFHE